MFCAARIHIYVSREDLGEAGTDLGAIERLSQRIRESRVQEASVVKDAEEHSSERQA